MHSQINMRSSDNKGRGRKFIIGWQYWYTDSSLLDQFDIRRVCNTSKHSLLPIPISFDQTFSNILILHINILHINFNLSKILSFLRCIKSFWSEI